MKERPILFSAPMVRALLDGSKTQTRRAIDSERYAVMELSERMVITRKHGSPKACPYGQPGDQLWVRETFYEEFGRAPQNNEERKEWVTSGYLVYRANDDQPYGSGGILPWNPSIFMPRWASRITLELTGVRVERLQDISEADAIAEGIGEEAPFFGCPCWTGYGVDSGVTFPDDPVGSYRSLWESINSPSSWDANPWVWVIEFKVVKP